MVTHLTVPLVLELFVKWPLQTEKFRVCCQLPSLSLCIPWDTLALQLGLASDSSPLPVTEGGSEAREAGAGWAGAGCSLPAPQPPGLCEQMQLLQPSLQNADPSFDTRQH